MQLIMATQNLMVIDPAICHGKPIIRGARVPVTVAVGSLAGGMTTPIFRARQLRCRKDLVTQ